MLPHTRMNPRISFAFRSQTHPQAKSSHCPVKDLRSPLRPRAKPALSVPTSRTSGPILCLPKLKASVRSELLSRRAGERWSRSARPRACQVPREEIGNKADLRGFRAVPTFWLCDFGQVT